MKLQAFRRLRNYSSPFGIIRWRRGNRQEVKVILEVKGFESEQDRQKEAAAHRWVRAVNHHGEFGRWAFVLCKDPMKLKDSLSNQVEVP